MTPFRIVGLAAAFLFCAASIAGQESSGATTEERGAERPAGQTTGQAAGGQSAESGTGNAQRPTLPAEATATGTTAAGGAAAQGRRGTAPTTGGAAQTQRPQAAASGQTAAAGAAAGTGTAAQGQRSRPGGGTPPSIIGKATASQQFLTTTVGGRLRPANTVTHQASASGIVRSVEVREGQRVEVGQHLFTIEREDVAGSFKPLIVTSRIAGVVSEILVQPANEIRSGVAGVTVLDTSGFSLTASISDKDAFKVRIGDTVTGKAVGGESLSGKLVARSPEPDYRTGLYTLTFRFPNVASAYLGQFVAIELPVGATSGIFIPQSVLVRRYGRYFVWTVTPENTLKTIPVTPGPVFGSVVLIKDGLDEGDSFLTRVSGREREGDPVPGR